MARLTTAALLTSMVIHACGSQAEGRDTLRIFAASSLRDLMDELEPLFEKAHPQIDLQIAFAGSQTLRFQIEEGAPADIFISANRAHIDALVATKRARAPRRVARNTLALIVPSDNPANITTLAELTQAKRVVLGTRDSPIGVYAEALLEGHTDAKGRALNAAIAERVVSRESNVRLIRAKVALGEADAAIVYATDAQKLRSLHSVPLPPNSNRETGYYGAEVGTSAMHSKVWWLFLESPVARDRLLAQGFGAP